MSPNEPKRGLRALLVGGGLGALPAWSLSVAFHAVLLVTLALTLQITPRGITAEPGREVGVVLKRTTSDGETLYETEGPESNNPVVEAVASTNPTEGAVSSMFGEQSPVDISQSLPTTRDVTGLGPGSESATSAASSLTTGPAQPRMPSGGKARTSVYGLEAEGYKFAYVFDRSASTGGGAGSPLAASKKQMLDSIDDLESTHQFQIVFYNHEPSVFGATELGGRLVFANDANKQRARAYVGGIIASGGTEHERPLLIALGMQPDVIFFLTDADQPSLSSAQLDRIRRANRGTSIHAIEFGLGPSSGGENFLMRLARENNGKYKYINVMGGL